MIAKCWISSCIAYKRVNYILTVQAGVDTDTAILKISEFSIHFHNTIPVSHPNIHFALMKG